MVVWASRMAVESVALLDVVSVASMVGLSVVWTVVLKVSLADKMVGWLVASKAVTLVVVTVASKAVPLVVWWVASKAVPWGASSVAFTT